MPTFRSLLLATAMFALLDNAAYATPPFYKEFERRYGDAAPGYGGLIKNAKCNICHIAGEKKNIRNEYGEALKDAGLKKELAKPMPPPPDVVKAIDAAFKKAAEQKSSQGDTYGERIKQGKLPAP